MIKNGDNVILKFRILDGELCRDNGKAYIYPSMARALQYYHPNHEELVEYTPVVHGQWEASGFDGHGDYKECCSNCAYWSIGADKPYCPICGAKMDGDNNEHIEN